MGKLYKVLHEKTSTLNQTLGIFPFKSEAEEFLHNLIDEYHEEIAFEEDYCHLLLDNRFWSTHKIVEVNH
jgi:hypothetical protein